jgi:hypothetical protein
MKKLIPTDNPNFVKDSSSGALLNTNVAALEEYKQKRNMQNRINTLEGDVKSLNTKLDDVLNLLTKLVGN